MVTWSSAAISSSVGMRCSFSSAAEMPASICLDRLLVWRCACRWAGKRQILYDQVNQGVPVGRFKVLGDLLAAGNEGNWFRRFYGQVQQGTKSLGFIKVTKDQLRGREQFVLRRNSLHVGRLHGGAEHEVRLDLGVF